MEYDGQKLVTILGKLESQIAQFKLEDNASGKDLICSLNDFHG